MTDFTKAREEPIPEKTRSEKQEESQKQLRMLFSADEDISNLSNSHRRQRRGGYSSIDELLNSEFNPSVEKPACADMSASDVTLSGMPEGRSGDNLFPTEEFNFDNNYKMVLHNFEQEIESQTVSSNRYRWLNLKDSSRQKKLSMTKNLKNMKRFEASRRLFQHSISFQQASLQIDSQPRCVFSLGKHLYSNTISGKLKLSLGGGSGESGMPAGPPLVRSFRKIQECTILSKAATMAGSTYQPIAQVPSNFDECSEVGQQSDAVSVSYLAFFEEGFLLNMTVCQTSRLSSLKAWQLLATASISGTVRRYATESVTSLLDSLNRLPGDIRIGDLLRLVHIKLKRVELSLN